MYFEIRVVSICSKDVCLVVVEETVLFWLLLTENALGIRNLVQASSDSVLLLVGELGSLH